MVLLFSLARSAQSFRQARQPRGALPRGAGRAETLPGAGCFFACLGWLYASPNRAGGLAKGNLDVLPQTWGGGGICTLGNQLWLGALWISSVLSPCKQTSKTLTRNRFAVAAWPAQALLRALQNPVLKARSGNLLLFCSAFPSGSKLQTGTRREVSLSSERRVWWLVLIARLPASYVGATA